MSIGTILKTVLKDTTTTPAGDFEPARIVGYGLSILGGLVFLFCTIYMTVSKGVFNATDFAIGLAGISAAVTASALGVVIKKSDEVPYVPPLAETTAPSQSAAVFSSLVEAVHPSALTKQQPY